MNIRPFLRDLQPKSYTKDPWKKLSEYRIKEEDVIDCSLGVNPYGCSSLIKKATNDVDWKYISEYPNTSYFEIKKSIINYWSNVANLDENEIFLGTGSVNILTVLNRLFVENGTKVLGYCPQFSEFENIVKLHGGIYEYIKLKKEECFKFSCERILKSINDYYDLIYIDNPNNPTGQIIEIDIIKTIAAKASKFEIPVIVDEAYGDFMDEENSAVSICEDYDNLFVVRSFSKGLGLANMRLGYLVTKSPLKKYYSTVNISDFVFPDIMSCIITEALNDKEFLFNCRRKIKTNKKRLISVLKDNFIIAETNLEVPILTIGHEKCTNLYDYLLRNAIVTASGEEFTNLGNNYTRLRIPSNIDKLIERLRKLNA